MILRKDPRILQIPELFEDLRLLSHTFLSPRYSQIISVHEIRDEHYFQNQNIILGSVYSDVISDEMAITHYKKKTNMF